MSRLSLGTSSSDGRPLAQCAVRRRCLRDMEGNEAAVSRKHSPLDASVLLG